MKTLFTALVVLALAGCASEPARFELHDVPVYREDDPSRLNTESGRVFIDFWTVNKMTPVGTIRNGATTILLPDTLPDYLYDVNTSSRYNITPGLKVATACLFPSVSPYDSTTNTTDSFIIYANKNGVYAIAGDSYKLRRGWNLINADRVALTAQDITYSPRYKWVCSEVWIWQD